MFVKFWAFYAFFQQKTIYSFEFCVYVVKKPFMISFDGISGTGKDTYIEFVKKELRRRGRTVVLIEEAKLNPFSREIVSLIGMYDKKEYDLYAGLLFNAGRKYIQEKYVRHLLGKDVVILLNRSIVSTMAQQSMHGVDIKNLKAVNEEIGIINPDLKFLFYCRPKTAYKRVKKRSEGRNVLAGKFNRTLSDFRRAGRQYIKAGKIEGCVFVNTEKDMNHVKKEILEIILKKLKKKQN